MTKATRNQRSHTEQMRLSMRVVEESATSIDQVLRTLNSNKQGLVENDALSRLKKFGKNEVSHEKPPTWYGQLLQSFNNPFVYILIGLAVVSYLTEDVEATIILTIMVVVSGVLRFVQEYRSTQAAEKLKALVSTTATVKRRNRLDNPGEQREITINELVPGDIIHLAAGDMIPADRTYFGSLAKNIVGKRVLTSFEQGVNRVSWLLIGFMAVMVPIVFLINGITKGNWFDAFLFGVSVAVGLTPEMLPMIVTANLAKGSVAMANQKVVVKRLNAIQNFGAMDVLCTDKTGTLTQDKIILERHIDLHGYESHEPLQYGYLNSYYQTGLKNLLDVAVLEHVELNTKLRPSEGYTKVDEIPFDFVRRRMSVVVEELNQSGDKHILICKGAVEEIFNICSHAKYQGAITRMNEFVRADGMRVTQQLNEDGFRVIAVAYKEIPIPQDTIPTYGAKDECDLILVGYLAFLDPPKDSASQAIMALQEHGVAVKIITGDNDIVTRKICQEVDLQIDGILLGSQMEKMNDEQLADMVDTTTVFAKMSPIQKAQIIRVLRSKGHTVGYMGDGINDAAALRDADVGISVDTAVDIAKESADIILLEKNLMVLERGVIEGRRTFANILKYLNMTASSNFGNVFSVMGSSAFLPFLPMQPIQLLTQNLLYDISQITIPFDNVDKDFLKKPQKWNVPNIGRFMLFIGPVSSIFDYVTFIVMWFVFDANTPEEVQLFNSGWFVEGLLSQTLIVHMIRTSRWPFLQSTASLPVLLLTGIIIAIGMVIPFTPLGAALGMVPLPMRYFGWLWAILGAYCLLTQAIKLWYIRIFGKWL